MMEIAKVDCSSLFVRDDVGTFAGGTGMYDVIREARPCFWMEYSGSGPSEVWMLTAKPLKHGMLE